MTVLNYDKTGSRDNHPTTTPVNLGIDHCFEIHHWPWSCLMIDSKALDLSDHLVTFSVPLDGGYAKANPANPGDGGDLADDVDPTVLKYGFDGFQKKVIIIS